MAALYSNFKISKSKLSGEFKASEQFILHVDTGADPDTWKVFNAPEGIFLPWKDVNGTSKTAISEFILTYNDLWAGQKDPIDNLKDSGFEIPDCVEQPDEAPLDRQAKLDALDKIMDEEQPKKQERYPVKKQPSKALVIPDNVRRKQITDLTKEDIKNYLCQTATDQEAYLFLQLCQARNLNPFLNEAYLIKYGTKSTMVVGKEAYMRRAEAHPQFDGFEAGIIIKNEAGNLEKREGTFKLPGESLVGGWAKIYRKDRRQPFISEVSLDEYNTKQSLWITKPATMIRKVAIVQGKREAFPSEFGGMYDAVEMGEQEVIEAVYTEAE